jgi:hypothetical protein
LNPFCLKSRESELLITTATAAYSNSAKHQQSSSKASAKQQQSSSSEKQVQYRRNTISLGHSVYRLIENHKN